MGKELYNNKSNVEEILGSLPKIGAPDNFEFNLMAKIKNENFSSSLNQPASKPRLSWIFAPAAVVTATVVILFFVFDFQTAEYENLLMLEPEARAEFSTPLEENFEENFSTNEVSDAAEMKANKSVNAPNKKEVKNNVQGGIAPNIAGGNHVSSKLNKKVLPYNDKDALDLDNYMNDGYRGNPSNNRALIVGGGNYNAGFDGFNLQINDAQLEVLKAKLDSLFNTMKDSLNNSNAGN